MRIIYLLGLIAGILFTSFATQWVFDAVKVPIDLMAASGAGQIINYALVLTFAWVFTALVWRQSVIGFFLLYARNWRKALGGFWFCAGLTTTVGLLWFTFVFAAGGARWSSAAWAQIDAHALLKLLGTGLVAIVVAATEEILFRALAFKYLLTSTAKGAVLRAMTVSAVIFALAHRFDDPLSWLEIKWAGLLIGLTLLGCLFALIYYLTNSLTCSIGAHTGLIWIALAKKTQTLQVTHSGWDITNSFDPRTGPAAWILFILLGVLFWNLRHRLKKTFAIEDLDLIAGEATAPRGKIDSAASPAFGHPVMRRERPLAILGVVACVAGFIAIQKLVDHRMALAAKGFPAAVEELKTLVARGDGIEAAAYATGFQPTDYIRARITVRRQANGLVEIIGAAADLPGNGHPLVFLILEGRKVIFQAQTDGGPDTDLARKYMLTDAAARNVKFNGQFSCNAPDRILGVWVTPAKTYAIFTIVCP